MYKGNSIVIADSHQKQWNRQWNNIFKMLQSCYFRILYSAKISFKNEGKIKNILIWIKYERILNRKAALVQIIKNIVQTKEKW